MEIENSTLMDENVSQNRAQGCAFPPIRIIAPGGIIKHRNPTQWWCTRVIPKIGREVDCLPRPCLSTIRVSEPRLALLFFTLGADLNGQCSILNVHCSFFNVQCALYNVHCSLLNVQCSMCIVQCSLFNVVPWTTQVDFLRTTSARTGNAAELSASTLMDENVSQNRVQGFEHLP